MTTVRLARWLAPAGLLLLMSNAASAGVCQNKQIAFNRLTGQDAAIVARMRAAGAANNCAGLIAAANQRLALLQRVASMRPGVVNCEDATHKNSDRDPPGYDAKEMALTRQVMSACSGAAARTAAAPSQTQKPAASPPPRAASRADGDCSDVSGTGGPRIQCKETRAAPVNPDKASAKPQKTPAVQEKPKPTVVHSAETGIATRIAAELFPEAVPEPAPPKPAEPTAEVRPDSTPEVKAPAVAPPSPELTAARERLRTSARAALASPSCSAYERVAGDAKAVAAAYRTLGDSANETAMNAKVAKIDNTVSEMRSSSRCGGFSVATPQSQGRNNAKPAKVSAADCATMMNYWKKIDHDAKGQNNVRADVAVARMEMMSAGVCNDTRYKPDLRECATASLRWAEANVSEQEIKRRLKVANCAQP
ncbi:MAG: hypothetical protein BGP05_03290 [Rhizobiales bacterium 62-47]|nr:hypothetical protein [Hyphomicrobiales bacterium]OJY12955.1 MAG: hypothetical protein BGP05_03290 [Rhizobiales bacterium 62-47]